MQVYSANKELKFLTDSLHVECLIFDDPSIGSGISLREKSKNADIDAVLIHENLCCLISVGAGGAKSHIEEKIKEFEQKLDKVTSFQQLELKLEIKNKNSNYKLAQTALSNLESHFQSKKQDYDIVLKKIFFAPNVRLDESTIDMYRNKDVVVIDKDIFDYFSAVFSRLNSEYLFYNFINFLGIRKSDFNKRNISGVQSTAKTPSHTATECILEAGSISMYSLALRAEEIKQYVTVLRIAHKYDRKGFQRMIKKNRLEKINDEYLSKNQTFPNNIIIALSPEYYRGKSDFWDSKQKAISFLDEYNSLIIIDGQHRFFSLIKGGKEDRLILVTFLFFHPRRNIREQYTLMERMFYKINKTQERIDPNLSFAIKARIEPESEEAFWYQVFRNLDKQGFFADKFSFRESSLRQKGEKKSIVSLITYGGVLKLNLDKKRLGVLSKGLQSSFYNTNRKKNIEFATRLLNNYFSIVKEVLYDQNFPKDKLAIREMGALMRLLRQFVLSDPQKVKVLGNHEHLKNIKDKKTTSYFKNHLKVISFQDVINLQYPASNWAAVEGYMLKRIHGKFKRFGSTKLLSKKGLEVYK